MVCQKKMVSIACCFLVAVCYVVLIKVIGTVLYRFKLSTDLLSLAAEVLSALIVIIIMPCSHKQGEEHTGMY